MVKPAVRADLASLLSAKGALCVSALVADAHHMSFAGFDLRHWLDGPAEPSRSRRRGSVRIDAFEARIEQHVVRCRGSLAGGASFGCSSLGGWIRIYSLDIEVLTSFRGPLRQLIDNPLLAMREYRVLSGDTAAGTTVLHFDCPDLAGDGVEVRS